MNIPMITTPNMKPVSAINPTSELMDLLFSRTNLAPERKPILPGWTTNAFGNADMELVSGTWQWVNTDVQAIGWPGPAPGVYNTVVAPEPATWQAAGLSLILVLVGIRLSRRRR